MNHFQKHWILETFFKNEDYPGWKNIATKLIETGSCITTTNIWHGGINNFITETEAPSRFVNCIELRFNVEKFISKENKYFMQYYNQEVKKLENIINILK